MSLKVLFLSTPVGPLGSGDGGGVELTLYNLALSLQKSGVDILTIAPENSFLPGLNIETIAGNLQVSAQTMDMDSPIFMPDNAVLARMWARARELQDNFDLICNFAYDWLPFYLTPFFKIPVAHLVSMGSVNREMARIIKETHDRTPRLLAFHTRAQADTFDLDASPLCLGNGLDLSLYEFQARSGPDLAWIGRISPEKALEDAIEACRKAGVGLKIFGKIADGDYWRRLKENYGDLNYRGFLPTDRLQRELGGCRGLLMTHRWIEAFGNVAIESLACGVPVISYARGGPKEIIEDGKTGFLVAPDSVEGLVMAIGRLDSIDRYLCRESVERYYSLEAMGARVLDWFRDILAP